MGKILYYTWIGIGIIIGLPIVLLILMGTWIHSKWHNLTCKKCKIK
jgi:hypothetical protein